MINWASNALLSVYLYGCKAVRNLTTYARPLMQTILLRCDPCEVGSGAIGKHLFVMQNTVHSQLLFTLTVSLRDQTMYSTSQSSSLSVETQRVSAINHVDTQRVSGENDALINCMSKYTDQSRSTYLNN